jgi:hypothetical protein
MALKDRNHGRRGIAGTGCDKDSLEQKCKMHSETNCSVP